MGSLPGDERSRSPSSRDRKRRRHHSRSRSPHQRAHKKPTPRAIPLNARQLFRRDLKTYRPVFALYLDIQKGIEIENIGEDEVKGRWKSFVNKWNRGELAEGWYDPQTLEKASKASSEQPKSTPDPVSEDEDDYGPSLPNSHPKQSERSSRTGRGLGPAIPSTSDIRAEREQASEDAALARQQEREDLRHERRLERKAQIARLDELNPRAEPGTKERQMEKKREAATSNRSFAVSAHEAGDVDVRESDVMGDEDSLSDLKRMKKEQERKKNEREMRREEILRARRAEREIKLAGMREKEEKTMEMLKDIAKARFGAAS